MASMTPRAICLLLISLALCHAAAGQQAPAQQIVQAFKEITQMSDDLRIEADKITFINALLQGSKVLEGFRAIVFSVGKASSMIQNSNMKALGAANAKTVVAALATKGCPLWGWRLPCPLARRREAVRLRAPLAADTRPSSPTPCRTQLLHTQATP